MIKLDYIVPENRFTPAIEHLKIDNDIRVSISRYDNGARYVLQNILDYDNCPVDWSNCALLSISNPTGDIADQVYEQAKLIEYFSGIKLLATSNYDICLPLEKLEDFLQYIEKIDRSTLKEGKSY